ncbi:MAG: Amuc_1099 family pilus-like system protein [Akkermansia sp.]
MSLKENYDKVFLITGGVFGLACLGFGVMTYSGMESKYTHDSSISSKEINLPGLEKSARLLGNIETDHQIPRPKVGAHYFDVFVAPVLWLKQGGTVPTDIYAEQAVPVHPPIPNAWFMDNGLNDAFRFSDASSRDSDNDGYTNLEEFQAKTNPSDPNGHPPLIKKLALTDISERGYLVIFSQDLPPDFGFKATTMSGADLWRESVQMDGVFGKKPADLARFKLKEIVKRDFKSQGTGVVETESVAMVEDLKPTKKGLVYEIRKGSKFPQRILDRTAKLMITAGAQAQTAFKVEEGKTFKIPGDDKTEYLLESIDSKAGTISIKPSGTDGSTQWKIKKQ